MLHSLILLQEKIQDKITDEALTRGAEEAQRHAAQAGETLKTTGHELAQRAGDVDSHINFVVSFSQDPERWPVAVGLLVIGVFALLFGQKYIKWVIMLAGAVSGFLMGHMGVKQVVALSQRVDFLREMVYEKVEEPARARDLVMASVSFPRPGASPRLEEGVVLAVASPKWHGVALAAAPPPPSPSGEGAAPPKEKEAVKPVAAKPETAPGKPDEKPKDAAAAAKPAEKLPLEGLAAGQVVEMWATFPADHEDKDLVGVSGPLRVTVQEVQRLSSGGLGGALA
ncbi:MAG: hypothetical protein HY719_02795, partial [Planctomycetes bacterium]|nr:hypothetical protein [Planctomycetota bacterium]